MFPKRLVFFFLAVFFLLFFPSKIFAQVITMENITPYYPPEKFSVREGNEFVAILTKRTHILKETVLATEVYNPNAWMDMHSSLSRRAPSRHYRM